MGVAFPCTGTLLGLQRRARPSTSVAENSAGSNQASGRLAVTGDPEPPSAPRGLLPTALSISATPLAPNHSVLDHVLNLGPVPGGAWVGDRNPWPPLGPVAQGTSLPVLTSLRPVWALAGFLGLWPPCVSSWPCSHSRPCPDPSSAPWHPAPCPSPGTELSSPESRTAFPVSWSLQSRLRRGDSPSSPLSPCVRRGAVGGWQVRRRVGTPTGPTNVGL